MSPEAYVIEVFSGEWIRNTVLTILFIVTYLFFGKFLSNKNKLIFAKAISVILIFITITGPRRATQTSKARRLGMISNGGLGRS